MFLQSGNRGGFAHPASQKSPSVQTVGTPDAELRQIGRLAILPVYVGDETR